MWVVSFMLTHAVYCKWRTLKILLVLYETELAILVRNYIIAEAFHIDWYQILSICVSPDWAVVKTIMFTFSYKWLSVYTSVYNMNIQHWITQLIHSKLVLEHNSVYNSLYKLVTESCIQSIHSTMIWSGVKEVI